ncbi:MAG: tetratricopeptide repeat protein [bacterium]
MEYLARSVGISEDIGERYTRSYSYRGIAEIYLGKRDLVKSLDFCNKALSLSTETGQKENIASSRRILGMVCRESSRWTEAIENFQESIRISEEIGSRLDAGKSRYEFGCMWKARGDAAKARGHLEKAAELFEALKIPKRAAEARAALEALDAEA